MTDCSRSHPHENMSGECVLRTEIARLQNKYQRAVWFLQDIAAMSRKIGSETAAHALAQLGEQRHRENDDGSNNRNLADPEQPRTGDQHDVP